MLWERRGFNMRVEQYKKGDSIHIAGSNCHSLELIVAGKAEMRCDGFQISLKRGAVIGSLEDPGAPYNYNYTALEDTTVAIYEYETESDRTFVVEDRFSNADVLMTACAGQVVGCASKYRYMKKNADRFVQTAWEGYEAYKELCTLINYEIQSFPVLDDMVMFVPEKEIPEMICDYYDQLELMPQETKQSYYGTHESIPMASFEEAVKYSRAYLKLCYEAHEHAVALVDRYFGGQGGNIFDLYINLAERVRKDGADDYIFLKIKEKAEQYMAKLGTNPIVPKERLAILLKNYQKYMESMAKDDEEKAKSDEIYGPVLHSMDTILKYACLDEGEEERFRSLVRNYKLLNDKNSSDEDVRKLRHEITKTFFDIYEAVALSSFENSKVPVVLKMFFNFGYIDEDLIGRENALKLYELAENMSSGPRSNVYTIYDWLRSIYNGENEPSKNEFDQDFVTYLKSRKQGGYINDEMEKRYLSSTREKVRFEIHNFFQNAVKIASGRPSTFCPLLSEHNVIKPLNDSYVTSDAIAKNWNIIRSIDYSCFYRETVYQNPEFRISREPIMLEVMPIVILVPGIGMRSGIWQETSGQRRDTPARMFAPIFTAEDLFSMQLKTAGEFRWELCKKIQGARWNDVTDHSITADYFDYLQFYRKNGELSPDAKEKVRISLSNNKNSFKNVFVSDYITWVRYESQGSPRLNRVAKEIMFKYCPFSKAIRSKLSSNPMYADMVKRHDALGAKTHKLLETRYSKMKNGEGELPPEIINCINFYQL